MEIKRVFGFVPVPSSVDGELDIRVFSALPLLMKVFASLDPEWHAWAKNAYARLSTETFKAIREMENAGALPASYLPAFIGADASDTEPYLAFRKAIRKLFEIMSESPENKKNKNGSIAIPDSDSMNIADLLAGSGTFVSKNPVAEESNAFDVLMGACIDSERWGPSQFREAFSKVPELERQTLSNASKHVLRMRARAFLEEDKTENTNKMKITWWGACNASDKDFKIGTLSFEIGRI